ncbi:hypothetical protein HLB35_14545 [Halomonas sp. TBZ9]|uniref:Uncharacterized protein n=1 Tax=Vreelandella azerica TaxID=2732867 RepID=A0A7Y3TZ41_9GAMM|nr:hypothetical protein [Halomonas azerica]NOG32673.1 hypothetical protein [Halomonas azerica]
MDLLKTNPLEEGGENAALLTAGIKVAVAMALGETLGVENVGKTLADILSSGGTLGNADIVEALGATGQVASVLLEQLNNIDDASADLSAADITAYADAGAGNSLLASAQAAAQGDSATKAIKAARAEQEFIDGLSNTTVLTRDSSLDDIQAALEGEDNTVTVIAGGMTTEQLEALFDGSAIASSVDKIVGALEIDVSALGQQLGSLLEAYDASAVGANISLVNGGDPISSALVPVIVNNAGKLAEGAISADDGIELSTDQLLTLLDGASAALEDGSAIVSDITTLAEIDAETVLANVDKLAPESVDTAGTLTAAEFHSLASALAPGAVAGVNAEGATADQLGVLAENIDRLSADATISDLAVTNELSTADLSALIERAPGTQVDATGMSAAQLNVLAGALESGNVASVEGTLSIGSGVSADSITALLDTSPLASESEVNVLTKGMTDNQLVAVTNNLDSITTLNIASGVTITAEDPDTIPDNVVGNGTLAPVGDIDSGPVPDSFSVATLDLTGATFTDGTFSLGDSTIGKLRITGEQADGLELTGTSGADRIEIDVSGAFTDGVDSADVALNLSTLAGNDHVVFDFGSEADNTVNLTGTLNFGNGNNILEASNGTVNIANLSISEGYEQIGLIVNSTVVMSSSQFQAFGEQLDALSGSGQLDITDVDADGVDLGVISFAPGGANLPVIRLSFADQSILDDIEIDTDGSVTVDWLESQNIGLPQNTDVILQVENSGEFIDVANYESGRLLFLETATVYNSDQLDSLLAAIQEGAEGIRGTQSSDVETVALGNNIALTGPRELDTTQLDIVLGTGARTLTLGEGVTITANAEQIDGASIVGIGSLLVNVNSSTLTSTDFSNLGSIATLQLNGTTTLGEEDNLPEFALVLFDGAELNASASQVSNQSINASEGTLNITDLGAVGVDFTDITGNAQASLVDDAVTLDADTELGNVTVALAEGQTLTLRAAQADNVTIIGDGSVVLTGFSALLQGDIDLSSIQVPVAAEISRNLDITDANLPDNLALDVSEGRTLTLTLDQAGSIDVSGEGGNTRRY